MAKKEATKTLTWEESWGKVNWKTLTIQQLYKLLENGADPFMVGKDGKGRIGLPINFLIWERDLHFNLGLPYDGSLDDRLPLTKKAQSASLNLTPDVVMLKMINIVSKNYLR